jgi:hypothetical protein
MNVVDFVLAGMTEAERSGLSSMHRSARNMRVCRHGLRVTAVRRRLADHSDFDARWME